MQRDDAMPENTKSLLHITEVRHSCAVVCCRQSCNAEKSLQFPRFVCWSRTPTCSGLFPVGLEGHISFVPWCLSPLIIEEPPEDMKQYANRVVAAISVL